MPSQSHEKEEQSIVYNTMYIDIPICGAGWHFEILCNTEEVETDIITGSEHKATYKAVQSSRIDTTALKKDMPDIAAQYTKSTNTKRFLFQ